MAYVPLPRVFPVLYCERGKGGLELESGKVKGGLTTWQGTVCEGGMIFVSSACGCDEIRDQAKVSGHSGDVTPGCLVSRPAGFPV